MKQLVFSVGAGYRKVIIRNRIVTFFSAETNFMPINIDLDKINEEVIEKAKESRDLLLKIKELKTEKDIADDIVRDFKDKGWRLIRK